MDNNFDCSLQDPILSIPYRQKLIESGVIELLPKYKPKLYTKYLLNHNILKFQETINTKPTRTCIIYKICENYILNYEKSEFPSIIRTWMEIYIDKNFKYFELEFFEERNNIIEYNIKDKIKIFKKEN